MTSAANLSNSIIRNKGRENFAELRFSGSQKEIYEFSLVILCQCQNVHALT